MPVFNTSIGGLLVVSWPVLADSRGFFKQTYQLSELSAVLGRDLRMQQGNHSRSMARVLRGFHAEPWDKLVYVIRGVATCVVADPRPDSPTFGHTASFLLGDDPGARNRLFISRGLANAFYCHTEVDYVNDVSEEFVPQAGFGIAWNDPDLAFPWPDTDPTLSEADRRQPTLRMLFPDHSVLRG